MIRLLEWKFSSFIGDQTSSIVQLSSNLSD
jgi:hypothetical protein